MPVQSSCNANGSGASYVVGQVAEKGWPGPNSGMSGGKRRKRNGSKTAKRRSGKRMKGGNCGCSSSSLMGGCSTSSLMISLGGGSDGPAISTILAVEGPTDAYLLELELKFVVLVSVEVSNACSWVSKEEFG